MSKHNLIKPVLAAVICILGATGSASAASDATAQFKSSITVGTCDISFKETMPMSFSSKSIDATAEGKATEIKPLTTVVKCATANKPEIKLSGTVLPTKGMIFFDAKANSAQGFGFMVREDKTGLTAANFYSETDAVSPASTTDYGTVGAGTETEKKWMIGLVRADGTAASAKAGDVEASVKFSVAFK
ncbi:hypothetical protein NRH57_001726 [Providencia rettgeri]|uniref:hypothetical protein n=1 Tax=Providencia TaxID=586 RepID=UPI0024ABACB0|nr:hypothetical protein [Providencia rettgeri]ELR5253856.1 hypothetical protein [Providencia rettgeri]ELR5256147.1 hypothetical protein [Providencia rettgeri]ELT5687861.1 hypothetical protein [Providencia rettgeri]